jgi:hypothetical protein
MTLIFRRYLFIIMAEHREVEPGLVNPGVRYEREDVRPSWLIIGAAAIVLFGLIGLGFSLVILNTMETRRSEIIPTPLPLIQLRPTPLPPRLQPNPLDQRMAEEDMATLRSREEELLNSYGWVDREAGIVRIPIDQAIEILAEDGAGEPNR